MQLGPAMHSGAAAVFFSHSSWLLAILSHSGMALRAGVRVAAFAGRRESGRVRSAMKKNSRCLLLQAKNLTKSHKRRSVFIKF